MNETTHLLRQVRMVGRFAWLGGYTHAVLVDDGELIGPECVAPNYGAISTATRWQENNGWRAVAVVALEGSDEPDYCAHCGKELW